MKSANASRTTKANRKLTPQQHAQLISTLQTRFMDNISRHKDVKWASVEAKLEANAAKLWSLNEMERTGGQPDVVAHDKKAGEFVFFDCSPESPKERRSVCYDHQALASRKEHKPKDSAENMAKSMGIELLTEEQYRQLQSLGEFDTKTSSWVSTPAEMRKLGGALFGDFRFGRVFFYHNGAESYYAARGFRGSLTI